MCSALNKKEFGEYWVESVKSNEKNKIMNVEGIGIVIKEIDSQKYVSLTDIAKKKNSAQRLILHTQQQDIRIHPNNIQKKNLNKFSNTAKRSLDG